jgi:hypothetical protein
MNKNVTTLYKYRSLSGDSFKYTQDIFLRNRMFLCDYKILNDPAEGLYRNKVSVVNGYAEHSPLINPDESAKITCFSESPNISLMWSHYAESHSGICVGFDKRILLNSLSLHKVSYNARVPVISNDALDTEKHLKAFTVKSKEWSYEKEWRAIYSGSENFISFPKEALKYVFYGVNTSEGDIQWVRDWIKYADLRIKERGVEFSGHAARMHKFKYT